MQEGLAAHIAFLRAVAVEQSIYAIEIIIAALVADGTFLAESAGVGAGKLDALGGIRMARQEVEALIGFGIDRHESKSVSLKSAPGFETTT